MKFGIRLFVLIEFICLVLLCPVFAEDDLLTSVNELNKLENTSLTTPSTDTNRIIITYKNNNQNNIRKLGLDKDDFVAGETSNVGVDVLETKDNVNPEELINEISDNNIVESVDYDEIIRATDIPNDSMLSNQSYYSQINAQDTWDLNARHLVKVAVMDSGLDTSHEDLQGRYLLEGKSYVDNNMDDLTGHGTEVAGIINAVTNNSKGIAGICGNSNVKVVPYKILNGQNIGFVSDLVLALKDIQKTDVKVINLSLSLTKNNQAVESAIKEVYKAGKIVVAATGNYNQDEIEYPARYDEVIAVGAVNNTNNRCTEADWGTGSGSNYGTGIDFVAPGNKILSSSTKNGPSSYNIESGTSFAAPMVAGEVALLSSIDPNLTENSVQSIIKNTATDLGDPGYDKYYGNGLINIKEAVEELKNPKKDQVYFTTDNLTLYINQVYHLAYRTGLESPFTWTSSNPDVVSVENGELHALKFGSADITITSNEVKTVTATCHIVVAPAKLEILANSEHEGWLTLAHSDEIAGTIGKNQKLLGLIFSTDDNNLNLRAKAHVENIGTTDYFDEKCELGNFGLDNGIEALQLDLTGPNAPYYQLYYRVHVEDYGWTDWVTNNQWVGTSGHNLQLEAVEVSLQPVDTSKPSETANVTWTYNFN